MATLTSSLVINLVDNVSANAASVVRSLRSIDDEVKRQSASVRRELGGINEQRSRGPATRTPSADGRQYHDEGAKARRAWNEGFEGGGAQSDAGRILGGYLGAQAVRSGTRQLFNSAGSVEQERKLLQAQSGLTPDDLTEIEKRAEDISSRYKQITKAAAMRAISELRMALTDIQGAEHSMEFMETAAKAHTVLTNMTHVGKLAGVNADEAVFDLAKAMELRGITTKEGMEHGVDMMIKGIIASGGKIDARDWHMVSKALRSSLNQMSDEFLYKFMPTFMQEMKAGGGTGVQAGTAGLSLYRTIVGGRMTPRAAAQFDDLGLLNEDRVERKKNGDIKWLNPDAVVGNDIAQKDMFKWVNEVLKPALERKGITDIAEQARYFSTLFSNQVSEHMANMLLTQSNRLQRDAEMIGGVAPLDDLLKIFKDAPVQSMAELKSSLTNLYAAFGDAALGPAIAGIKALTEAVGGLTKVGQQHPVYASIGLGVGVLTAGMLLRGMLKVPGMRAALNVATSGMVGFAGGAAGRIAAQRGILARAYRGLSVAGMAAGAGVAGYQALSGNMEGAAITAGATLGVGVLAWASKWLVRGVIKGLKTKTGKGIAAIATIAGLEYLNEMFPAKADEFDDGRSKGKPKPPSASAPDGISVGTGIGIASAIVQPWTTPLLLFGNEPSTTTNEEMLRRRREQRQGKSMWDRFWGSENTTAPPQQSPAATVRAAGSVVANGSNTGTDSATADVAAIEGKAQGSVTAIAGAMAQVKGAVAAVDLTAEGRRIAESLAAGIRSGVSGIAAAAQSAADSAAHAAVRGAYSDGGIR